jgi:hypothetical protein
MLAVWLWTAIRLTAVDAAVTMPMGTDANQRLLDVTTPLLGAPYHLSALGEGDTEGAIDTDPRFRVDAFDCTTFVETAMALASSTSIAASHAQLDRIRYDGAPSYASRRHFPEAEWLPALTAMHVLKDITRDVGGSDVVVEKKILNLAVWKRGKKKGLPPLKDDRIPNVTTSIDVWPIAAALAHGDRIPPGTVVSVVRADVAAIPVRVSHQGLVLQKSVNGQKVIFIRHAADRLHHHVVDEPIEQYLKRLAQHKEWPVTGIHLDAFQLTSSTTDAMPAAAATGS